MPFDRQVQFDPSLNAKIGFFQYFVYFNCWFVFFLTGFLFQNGLTLSVVCRHLMKVKLTIYIRETKWKLVSCKLVSFRVSLLRSVAVMPLTSRCFDQLVGCFRRKGSLTLCIIYPRLAELVLSSHLREMLLYYGVTLWQLIQFRTNIRKLYSNAFPLILTDLHLLSCFWWHHLFSLDWLHLHANCSSQNAFWSISPIRPLVQTWALFNKYLV